MRKIGKIFVIIIIVIAFLNLAVFAGLKIWQSKDEGEIPKVIESALVSFSRFDSNKAVKEFKETMGGVATGVCHPKNDAYNVSLLKEANIGWVRFDIPSETPYLIDEHGKAILDENGNYQLTNSYKAYKDRCKIFTDAGYKVMGITPYVDDMLAEVGQLEVFEVGGEFNDDFKAFIKEVSKFYANDLQGYVSCFQISNELTIDKWQGALTTEQVCYYQGELQMKSMFEITSKAGIPIGFNVCGYTLYDYPKYMCDTYGDYFDYIALDLYLGCFEGSYKTTLIYDLLLRHFFNISNKPVMLNEFGYISTGTPKNEEERAAYLLATFGEQFSTEEKIRNNIVAFLDKFDEVSEEPNGSPMTKEARRIIKANGGEDNLEALKACADYVLGSEQIAHLYKALPDGYYLSNYEHTAEGQADFYEDTIKRLSKLDFMCGFFVYCYADSDECYQCGQNGCPVETGWGLVTISADGTVTKKPSYYAIQKVFGEIVNK